MAASNYDKTLPENCVAPSLPGLKGQRWLKGVALYGPNAGGKSSLVDALEGDFELLHARVEGRRWRFGHGMGVRLVGENG